MIHISRIYIEGFRRFQKFDLALNDALNIIVGDNETGKSSVLEAIGLVLSHQYDGRNIDYALDPYLFNAKMVQGFFEALRQNEDCQPPRILIEAYFDPDTGDAEFARLTGTNNSKGENCPGLSLSVEVRNECTDELKQYARDSSNPVILPVEFYAVAWRSFSGETVTIKNLPLRVAIIDTTLPRAYRGPNKYVAQVVNDVLTEEQRRQLSLAYKKLRHEFTQEAGVAAINSHLATQGNPATKRNLTVQMDMSSRSSWDSAITAHLDDLPFDCAGKGEQCRIQMRLAVVGAEKARVLLVEEPENHLSHSNLHMLMDDLRRDCADRQVIATTHSAFVLNRLGIDNLKLVSQNGRTTLLTGLTHNTRDYFMKLPGYDTLRLVLSKRSILVEGPSDELIVQRAYRDKHGKLPLEDGVDVISVGALAFKRFLEIAELLGLDVRVVTDNDGDVSALKRKYGKYLEGDCPTIRICFDEDEDCRTLEVQLLKANSLRSLNSILSTSHPDNEALLKYMRRNKTDCALALFETNQNWCTPNYIVDAIE
jgi:predicted ATPase